MIFQKVRPLSRYFNYSFCPDYFSADADRNSSKLHWKLSLLGGDVHINDMFRLNDFLQRYDPFKPFLQPV